MAVTTTNLGVITAYGDAVAAGYTGTKAEWQALMASYATVAEEANDAKDDAVAAKNTAVAKATEATTAAATANTAKDTATSKATEATTAANTATTKANEASASAQSIAQSAAQIQENTDSIDQLKSEFTALESDGVVPSAEQILSDKGVTDSVPYHYRKTGGDGADRLYDQIVGGTVCFNQLCNDASVIVQSGRKYLSKIGTAWAVGTSTGTAITGLTSGADMIIDLTAMFGSTIADYIYSLETAHTGDGVAFFKSLFPNDYYEYNAGELLSVSGLSAHVMRDVDDNIIRTYPLDSTLTLRGIPELDSNNKLYFDGDTYDAGGTVTRKYGIVDLGTLTWAYFNPEDHKRFGAPLSSKPASRNLICTKYQDVGYSAVFNNTAEGISIHTDGSQVAVYDTAYTDAATFKAAMSGVMLVYELATPTTEEADPYQHLQQCDPNGTEEYVSTGIVPVGHNSFYPENLRAKIEQLPWNFANLIAPTEATFTATRNYTTGSLFIVDNVLYKATANIANGGTITPNTNCTATTLAEIISALA